MGNCSREDGTIVCYLSSSAPRRELTFAAPLTTADGIAAVDEASAGGVTARRAMVLGTSASRCPQQPAAAAAAAAEAAAAAARGRAGRCGGAESRVVAVADGSRRRGALAAQIARG